MATDNKSKPDQSSTSTPKSEPVTVCKQAPAETKVVKPEQAKGA